ncbi:MAG: hypothetical protein JGK21_31350 [Microcoleus sp. PH2017_22_RUC_O_B]|uniref:hypothetical protein n=1 Tax=unclassified Microcoleus TaxID=2642155 RepID=UPI001D362378|nr:MULTISPECIES: hypothetical protein [unclassified Microcoleus]MCC3532568.1 hypothetical protein [Microcoleus sp. PH2017_21_RUC_O_A]MCC3544737.1 hypothetical protein [Microcoleus sp. PH2017_22_RUC_O_B]
MTIAINAAADNWQTVWQLSIVQQTTLYPRQYCPVLIQSSIIMLKLELLGGFFTGRLGGYLNQHIDTGIIGSGVTGARVGSGKKVFVDELQIILFEIEGDSVISFDMLARIASNGVLTVFEYTGEIN